MVPVFKKMEIREPIRSKVKMSFKPSPFTSMVENWGALNPPAQALGNSNPFATTKVLFDLVSNCACDVNKHMQKKAKDKCVFIRVIMGSKLHQSKRLKRRIHTFAT